MDFKPVLAWFTGLGTGDRAELRRAHTPLELAVSSGFHSLRRLMPEIDPLRLGQIARVLAFVSNHDSKSLGKALRPVMSEARLRRLVESDREPLPSQLIGAVRLLRGSANVIELAETIYWWGERRARQLAYDYFGSIKEIEDDTV